MTTGDAELHARLAVQSQQLAKLTEVLEVCTRNPQLLSLPQLSWAQLRIAMLQKASADLNVAPLLPPH